MRTRPEYGSIIWQWESQLREHDEHQYEYTIPDSVKRLKETLTQAVDAITAQIPDERHDSRIHGHVYSGAQR